MTASIITPVTLLTGFLGSGKTTLLNRMLTHPSLHDTAVLINEFGAVPIDHLLVRSVSGDVVVMANGCVCCSVAGDMVNALRDLYFKRANAEIPYFKRVIIETTGLADPAPIMHTLIEMPLVAARYALSGIVTTVDATHGESQLDQHFESVKQAAVADRIVITKIDLATPAQLSALQQRLTLLNPGATIFTAAAGDIDPERLLDTGLYQQNVKTPDVEKWLRAEVYKPVTADRKFGFASAASLVPSTSRHDERIRAFAVIYVEPVMWQSLLDALELLTSIRGDELLRIKGIVNVLGETTPRAIHGVQHTLYPAAKLSAWPDDDRRTRIVFITRDLSESFIRDTLDSFIKPTRLAIQAGQYAP